MKFTEDMHRKLKETLTAAYHEREEGKADELWQVGVMNHIRSMGPLKRGFDYFEFFEPFVWRLAPVACALILILAAIFFQMDFLSDYEVAKVLMEDPVDYAMFQTSLNM